MKVRDSGMPPEEAWESFFRPVDVLRRLGVSEETKDVADFGCGYGTFTIPAARLVQGIVTALDIDEEMVQTTARKAKDEGLANVAVRRRDFVSLGSGLADSSVEAALLFNILHAKEPVALLREAHRILKPSGKALVTHWNPDEKTPRGPSLDIRPTPSQCVAWGFAAGFTSATEEIPLPPYHYGLIFTKG